MTPYELTVEHVDGDVVKTRTPSGHEMVMDASSEPGGKGPTPVELLLASIGACSLMDVATILAKRRLDFHDLSVRVVGQRREEQPRAFTAVELVYEVSGEVPTRDLERACELSVGKYCSVLATVREAPPVRWTAKVRG